LLVVVVVAPMHFLPLQEEPAAVVVEVCIQTTQECQLREGDLPFPFPFNPIQYLLVQVELDAAQTVMGKHRVYKAFLDL
jgi:hypothetical protein